METKSIKFKVPVPSDREVCNVVVKKIEGDKVTLEYEQRSRFKNGQIVSINERPAILDKAYEGRRNSVYAVLETTGKVSYDTIRVGDVTEATIGQTLLLLDALEKDGYNLLPDSRNVEKIPPLGDLVYHIVLDNEGFGYKEEKWRNAWEQRYALHKGTILLSQEEVRFRIDKINEILRGSL